MIKLKDLLNESGAQIAKTILNQLGGNKFIAMTGAKNLGHTNKGLQMKIGRNAKGVTHVIIDLDRGKDLYDIEFVKVRGMKRTTVKKLKGVYADQLGIMFKKYTGMNVRLQEIMMIKLKKLLKESTWGNRKFGEKLPTMKDYKVEYEKKQQKL